MTDEITNLEKEKKLFTCGSNGDKFVYRNVLERISECFSKEKNFTQRGKQLQSWNLKHKHKCTKTKLYNKMYKYVPKENLAFYSPIQEKFCFYMKLFRDANNVMMRRGKSWKGR